MHSILIVDDHALVRAVLEVMLEARGFAARSASGAAVALSACRERLPDGLLVDIDMPGMDGVELCRQLRPLFVQAGAPFRVWLMTGVRRPELEQAAMAAGARGILLKPFTTLELYGHVSRMFDSPPSESAA